MRPLSIALVLFASSAFGDSESISSAGIDSKVTGLDGTGILIGQAEPGRAGKPLYDTDPLKYASNTVPAGVYFTTSGGMAGINSDITPHATEVAEVMIAKDHSVTGQMGPYEAWEGVAPNASLHSASIGGDVSDVFAALTMNRLATLAGGTVRATNVSVNRPLQVPIEQPDGNAHLTQFVDWSARQHDVLYAVAWGNDNSVEPRTPVDNYNGITVGASEQPMNEDVWRKFSSINSTEGLDHSDTQDIEILAPGHEIRVITLGDQEIPSGGTSLSAPHVTGATALLQQYSLQQIQASNPRFTIRSQRHQVMKAILLNSADKLGGVHGSTRDAWDSGEMDWRQSEAYISPDIPLDDQMGAGLLNVRRAVHQLATGEYSVGELVSHIGWGYSSIGGVGSSLNFIFDEALGTGYVAITLVWDRRIESTGGTTYSSGDQFFNSGVANLDLTLENSTGTIIYAESRSVDKNVEHIFFDLQTAGASHIRIRHAAGDIGLPGASTEFGIAWWYGDAAAPIPGDYNKNGSVGPEDYDVWKSNFGSGFADADGNGNGTVDAGDYTIWRDNLGAGAGSGGLASVPEPSTGILIAIGIILSAWRRRKC